MNKLEIGLLAFDGVVKSITLIIIATLLEVTHE